MISVSFADHSGEFLQQLQLRAQAACYAAAQVLAEDFRSGLQQTQAPPHSVVGEIPHKYDGYREFGYDDKRRRGIKNNAPETDFSATQSDYLSNYIEASRSNRGAVIGFMKSGSHVTRRDQNYLIYHDQGMWTKVRPEAIQKARLSKKKIPRPKFVRRPWIQPIYKRSRARMISEAADAFMMSPSGGGSGDTPF